MKPKFSTFVPAIIFAAGAITTTLLNFQLSIQSLRALLIYLRYAPYPASTLRIIFWPCCSSRSRRGSYGRILSG
ncbi:uncharacterized protein DS421_20g697900 [Arachis hypogaea]|nr:uncharacterized protein DS421_20g697900 [Arachis hypogaea]